MRWAGEDMVSEKGKHKARVLSFWAKHGLEATVEAFGVKRRTVYLWREQLMEGSGKLEALNERSKAPRCRRRRIWPQPVITQMRRLRTVHPNLGKEELYAFLKAFAMLRGYNVLRPRPIGGILADAPGQDGHRSHGGTP